MHLAPADLCVTMLHDKLPQCSYRPQPYADPPSEPLAEAAHDAEPLLMTAARHMFFLGGTIFNKTLLGVANT
jgi:hypothetical protein